MKKIPTIFERDWHGNRSLVVNKPHTDCEWVLNGEGVATKKLDGMCAAIIDGKLFKRREVKKDKSVPDGFIQLSVDIKTGKSIGWVAIGDGPEDKFFREALLNQRITDGTYELVGPKSQGNAEKYEKHFLISHNDPDLVFDDQPPRDFEGLKKWLTGRDIEGIVFHHYDGRYAKIKLRDFGLRRN